MKLVILTSVALITAGSAHAQSMPSPTANAPVANPAVPAEPMSPSPSATSTPGAMTSDTMTEKMARDKLSGAGYGSVSSLKRNADGEWEAVTKQGSKQQRVTVAADGTVSPQAPM